MNFWLVAVAFLVAAYVQSLSSDLHAVAVGVAGVGALASIAFQRLDARTRHLTLIAEDALATMETRWSAAGLSQAEALVSRSRQQQRNAMDSYRTVIQGLQLSVGVIFLLALVYAAAAG